ncbi:hypothetical protein LEMLEM_LOCUS6713, partial [Lemmus lemmus]
QKGRLSLQPPISLGHHFSKYSLPATRTEPPGRKEPVKIQVSGLHSSVNIWTTNLIALVF